MKKDIIVFHEHRKFAAWPAGYICKSWGDEIIAAYMLAEYSDDASRGHHFVKEQEWHVCISRSLDNGKTWEATVTDLIAPAPMHQARHPELLKDFDGKLDFSDPDFVLFFNMSGARSHDYSWWHYSTDRGRTWHGPYKIPQMPEVPVPLNMRTAYLPVNKDEMLVLCSCQKSTGREGRVFCAKMFSDGRFEFQGWIGQEFSDNGFMIMPQIARRKDGTLVSVIRTQETVSKDLVPKGEIYYISQYESTDEGKTWTYAGNPVMHHGGNPPALAVMKDGTWVLAFGARVMPMGIRCVYSEDEGRTWSNEISLRIDGHKGEIGYPRATALDDGTVFVCYYIGLDGSHQNIEASVFDKDFLKENTKQR